MEDFIRTEHRQQLELQHYSTYKENPKELINRIAWAITSEGKTHSHQRRITKSAKLELEEHLIKNFETIKGIRKFEDYLKLCRRIKGIGPLTSYDVATRLGICFNIFPDKVYLHCGTRTGAKNLLGDKIKGKRYLYLSELPKELHCLTPLQIEDFLCIYKNLLLDKNMTKNPCIPKRPSYQPQAC